MKHREHTSNTLTKGAVLLTLLSVLLVPFSSTNAYFSDKESSLGNLFGASTLDMGLVVSGGGNERTFSVSNIGESPFEYDVRIVETSNPLASFCGGVVVENMSDAPLLNLGIPGGSLEATEAAPGFTLEFGVTDPNVDLGGQVCVVEFVFEASQDGYNHGEAFFDTEVYTLTLLGEDYGSTPTPTTPAVVLNEVLANPEGADGQEGLQGEWVELYNNSSDPVDLTGWYVMDSANHTITVSAANTWNGRTTIGAKGSGLEWVVLFMNGEILNNSGDTVTLYNASGVEQDSYSFGDHATDGDSDSNHTGGGGNTNPSGDETEGNEGKSDARIPDGTGPWIDPVPTPGAPNELEEEETDAAPLPSADPLESEPAQNEAAAMPPEAPPVVDPLAETPKKEEEEASTAPEVPRPPVEEKASKEPIIEKALPSEPQAPREESEPEVTENAE